MFDKFMYDTKFIEEAAVGKSQLSNPFRPGAGHMPPYLAGREDEKNEFRKLLKQDVILENMILTGLRGVGKTVLLDTLKPIAINEGWRWVGTDLSEASSLTDERIALRLMADLAPITSEIVLRREVVAKIGFNSPTEVHEIKLGYPVLLALFNTTPGLVEDKLKALLEFVWERLQEAGVRGIVFAYDEAQNLSDYAQRNEFPLSLLLDVFQSIQRKNIPFMLVLVGLPTLFPKLVEARTFAERMFHVVFLERLNEEDSREAITRPVKDAKSPWGFSTATVTLVIRESDGYPYFIQFICRELFDLWLQKIDAGEEPIAPIDAIIRKLDSDFFAGRWARATERQRDLLVVIGDLPNCDREFTVQEAVMASKSRIFKPFSASLVNQMLAKLSDAGLIYKNRHGKYSFAVPLLSRFIQRQQTAD